VYTVLAVDEGSRAEAKHVRVAGRTVTLDLALEATDPWLARGAAALGAKRYDEAEEAFRKSRDAGSPRGLAGLAEVAIARGNSAQAVDMMQSEAERNPRDANGWFAAANIAARAGRIDIALADYAKVLPLVESRGAGAAEVHLRVAEILRRTGDLKGARQSLEKARALAPAHPQAALVDAMLLEAEGRTAEARGAYEQVLMTSPDSGVALNNLAFLLAGAGGDLDRALSLAERAREQLPDLPDVADTVGWIHLQRSRTAEAIASLSDAVARKPESALFHYHLGLAYLQAGDRTKARKEFRTALANKPSPEEESKIRGAMAR
jgi:tetratricopeptide (TPR) repeat protein